MSSIDGEAVILGLESGMYLGLNRIGTEIWQMLDKPVIVSDLIAALLEKYEEQEDRIRAHVLEFLNHLNEKSLIRLSDENQ